MTPEVVVEEKKMIRNAMMLHQPERPFVICNIFKSKSTFAFLLFFLVFLYHLYLYNSVLCIHRQCLLICPFSKSLYFQYHLIMFLDNVSCNYPLRLLYFVLFYIMSDFSLSYLSKFSVQPIVIMLSY